MKRLFRELLSSASNLKTIIFTSDYNLSSRRAIGELIGLSKHAPTLVHLVLELDLNNGAGNNLSGILPFIRPSPTLELLSIQDLAYLRGDSNYQLIAAFARNSPALKSIHFLDTVELEHDIHGTDSDWYHPESETIPGSRYSYAEDKLPRKGSTPWEVTQDKFHEIAERIPRVDTRRMLRPVFGYQFN
ncbi:hypothetical protein Moror_5925 [Moniliophthora roreri MCA 2997]|uniref:Uncharacterized protein n=2 Tax=Moniliophthora roreri TaxID=221103 RepID=V2WXY1_MONRO|nr:hypothetical protein Moror_5925 [Moniliophthora roreri MCA 2997]